ncbi:protein FAR1-RELATED SEQUENCE 6-like isoform X2 [Asparagus officinalis]|uniref:protein FAR1-RELATED SEQUENCE 6-like isoform X2 n=1 Tax=Asparagus officinalis TaxID=4686 RepID=UPI00098E4708|nr:protein FAR1-RELATED SEQUENCE 6-like isoform X2 [Asparagus officinalis]
MTSQDIVDNSAMEEKLDEENESIAMKNDVRMDECSSEDGLNPPIEDDGVSQSVPVDSISEELVNDDRDVSAVEGSDNGDVQKGKVELENDVKQNVGDGRTPQTGMIFKSYEEVVNFYKRYALRIGFGVAVKKSSFNTYGLCRRLVLVCTRGGKGRANECYQSRPTAKTDCPATVVAKLWGDGLLHLMEVNLEHNHPVSPSAARFLKCYKRLPGGMTKDLVVRARRHENLSTDDKEILNYVEGGRLKLGEGDAEAIFQFFAQMQAKNPNFFYLLDLDVEGHLKNVFWADARSRAAYKFFNDVISFDTSCIKDKYGMPLALFFGVNHHGQLVLLGCGLLCEESTENYSWILKTWLTCMLGSHPNAIITNECKTIQGINEIFPRSRHRICLWHVMKDIQEKSSGLAEGSEVIKALETLIFDSSTVDEFEEEWGKLINGYGLEGNEWFNSLYDIRHLWVPVFLKNTFWGGMSVSQHNDSLASFFEEIVCPETSVKDFLSRYEMILQTKYEMEAKADFDSLHKSRFTVSKFPMEEQVSKLYTLNMFSRFQDELKATVYSHVAPIKIDGSVSVFKVREHAYIENGENIEAKGHEVVYNIDGFQIQCDCNFFHFKGILCRHALSVFKLNQVYEVPSQYILDRWRRDFKQLHILAHRAKDVLGNTILERYDNLSLRYLQLVEIGAMSDEKFQLALRLIKEMEMSLLDDNTFRDLKSRLLVPDRSNGSDELTQMGFFEGSRTPSVPAKRRGRPPKKLKESNIETLSTSVNNKDTSTSLLVGSQNDTLQTVSTISQLGSHIRMPGGVDLMEEVNPNELSFGNQFGVHPNPQHHVGNQSVIQPSNTIQFGQQPVGNQSRMQWFYQEMLQEDQTPYVRRPG